MDFSLRLMPFQDKGASFLRSAKRAMLAWEPGVGKTPTAVRACTRVGAERVLVFCPPIATSVWRQHFQDWSLYDDIRVLDAKSASAPLTFIGGKGVRIIPYSRAHVETPVMAAATRFSDQWDVVILDEAHYLKNRGAKRTQGVYGTAIDLKGSPLAQARNVWCLTGTPLLNGPHEIWTHLKALAPDTITFPGTKGPLSEFRFVQRYCRTRATSYGVQVVGTKNDKELASRVARFADRKRIKDVLLDLPDLRIVDHPLPDSAATLDLRQALRELVPHDFPDDETLLAAADSVEFSTARRLLGEAKVPGVADLVADTLEAGPGKVIVFAHHRSVIGALAVKLKGYGPLVITGATAAASRESAISAFQTLKHHRLILLAIDAASESITLTAATQVILAEPSPVPARNFQAIARAHRKGQKHPVLARFVLLPGTLDAHLMTVVARKTRDIARIVDPAAIAPTLAAQAELFPADGV